MLEMIKMKEAIVINNLTINTTNFKMNNLSTIFYEGVNTFICGPSGSGKTLFLKEIQKQVNENIVYYLKPVVIFDKSYFATSMIEDELRYVLLNEDQKEFINNFFDQSVLKMNPNDLTFYQKKLLIICSFFYLNPQMIFIDNLLAFLKEKDVKKFRDYFEEKGITLVVVSNNIDECLDYEYMIVLNNGTIAIEGEVQSVVKEERLLKRIGIGVPFYPNLSIQLKYYNLVDKIFFNKEELKKALWK